MTLGDCEGKEGQGVGRSSAKKDREREREINYMQKKQVYKGVVEKRKKTYTISEYANHAE